MTIRSRLILFLLPVVVLITLLISLFFALNWKKEISESFQSNLTSIVITTADLINHDDIAWIKANKTNPDILKDPRYQKYEALFRKLKGKLKVSNLSIVDIEPVKIGERVLPERLDIDPNPKFDGVNPKYAFRQVFLVDSEKEGIYRDFSESDAHLVYYTKQPLITPIYKGIASKQEYLTGYAPILDPSGHVIALVGADTNLDLLQDFVSHALLVALATSLLSIIFLVLIVMWVARRITNPVSELKNAALNLAAGDYDEPISSKGPKEIVELASTLNTMRECLLDHINRLRDSSLIREKLYGEQECALLLQNRMLDGVIERFSDPRVTIRHLMTSSSGSPQGLKISLEKSASMIKVHLLESDEEGFEGVYAILSATCGRTTATSVELGFLSMQAKFYHDGMPKPLHWSEESGAFIEANNQAYGFKEGDFIFLLSQDLLQIQERTRVKELLTKVMKQFAKEDFEVLMAMITSELDFLSKKLKGPSNIHMICVHINSF